MRVAICIPTRGEMKTQTVLSLIGLRPPPDVQVTITAWTSSSIVLNRGRLLARAREEGADYILWIDSDQTFPPDTVQRLLSHSLPFVGANIPKRSPPFLPTAIKGGKRLYTTKEKARAKLVEPVDLMGLGVALVSMTAQALAMVAFSETAPEAVLTRDLLMSIPRAIAIRVMVRVLDRVGGGQKPHALAAVEALTDRLIRERVAATLHGCVVRSGGKTIRVAREPGRAAARQRRKEPAGV